jgi:hypothetical protein
MQKLERKGNITLLRAVYDPESKRTRQKSIGSFRSYRVSELSQVPADIREKLTDNEREELVAWLSDRKEKESREDVRCVISSASFMLRRIADALEGNEPVTTENLQSALREIERISKAIKKRGVTKADIRSSTKNKAAQICL